MHTLKTWSTIGVVLTLFACGGNEATQQANTYTGVVKETGITTYQYGTHTLTNDSTFYALRSKSLDLNNYLNQEITLTADKIEGYPVDGGPVFLDVKKVLE